MSALPGGNCVLWSDDTQYTAVQLAAGDQEDNLMLTGEVHYLKNTEALMGNRTAWRSGNAQDSYPGGARFESRLEHRLRWPRCFMFFLSSPPRRCRDGTSIIPRPLPSKSFPLRPSSVVLPSDIVVRDTNSVTREICLLKGKVVPVLNLLSTTIWRRRRSGGTAPPFSTSALGGSEWSASRPGRFTSGERAPGTHCIEGWVDPRTGLDAVEWRQILAPAGKWIPVVQPVARCYTD
jgi:hypothetical protein